MAWGRRWVHTDDPMSLSCVHIGRFGYFYPRTAASGWLWYKSHQWELYEKWELPRHRQDQGTKL